MIGANHLPECMRLRMAQSPLAVVEDPFEIRLERLREVFYPDASRFHGGLRRRARLAGI